MGIFNKVIAFEFPVFLSLCMSISYVSQSLYLNSLCINVFALIPDGVDPFQTAGRPR